MIKLPPDVDINKLLDDLRDISWEASETLLKYAQIIIVMILKNVNFQIKHNVLEKII